MPCHLMTRHEFNLPPGRSAPRGPRGVRRADRPGRAALAPGRRSPDAPVRIDGSDLAAAPASRARSGGDAAEGARGLLVARQLVCRSPARRAGSGKTHRASRGRRRSPGEGDCPDAARSRDGGQGGARRAAGARRRPHRTCRERTRDRVACARACLPDAGPAGRRAQPMNRLLPELPISSETEGPRRHVPLWMLALFTLSGTLGMHIFVPALPSAAAGLHSSPGALQLTISVYIAGLAIGQLVYGPVSDRFGRRPTLIGGLVLFTISGLAALLAQSVDALIVSRLFQALGGCAGLILARAIVRDTAASHEATRRPP